jgi:phosphatidylserine/phosphatidylglycerophosphate/cardiolipin synthase-like enzyme
LKAIPNLTLRQLEFAKVSGSGIIHAKFFVVDGRAAYVGSQNFDWRSLEHIDETGLRIVDRRIVGQVRAIFEQDWAAQARIAQGLAVLPLRSGDDTSDIGRPAFLVASPNRFDPRGVANSEAALVRLIAQAKREIHVEVMEYAATSFGGGAYPVIDDALRAAAGRGVKVQLLIADWDLTPARIPSLRSLATVPNVEIRVIRIPQASTGPIPYARVVHTKVMTIDGTTGWIGTSNWEGGYLDNSRNLEIVLRNRAMATRLGALLRQSWTSAYVKALEPAIAERQAQPAH